MELYQDALVLAKGAGKAAIFRHDFGKRTRTVVNASLVQRKRAVAHLTARSTNNAYSVTKYVPDLTPALWQVNGLWRYSMSSRGRFEFSSGSTDALRRTQTPSPQAPLTYN